MAPHLHPQVQYRTMLRVNWILGLHEAVDPKESVSAIDTAEAEPGTGKYGLGTARTAQQYWDWAGVVPGRSSTEQPLPEWSKNLCGAYSNGKGGLPLVPAKGDATTAAAA